MTPPEYEFTRRTAALRPGDPSRVGPYELLGLLGAGGMGRVYLGSSPAGRLVAVKVVHPRLAGDTEFMQKFKREAELARRVARFCTAEVLDVGRDGDLPYLVTEFVDGPTLSKAVTHDGPLVGASLERVAVATATALTAVHRAGLVHRDLKPSNVMLAPGGPLVIDFGIAQALDSSTLLSSGATGTPAYMAPEQVRGGAVGQPADVFAWGGTVVFAATGRSPFGTGPADALFYRIVHEQPRLDGIDEPLRSIVASAMSPEPSDRPTAQSLLARLLRFSDSPNVGARPSGRPFSGGGGPSPSAPPAPSHSGASEQQVDSSDATAPTVLNPDVNPGPPQSRGASRSHRARPARLRLRVGIACAAAAAALLTTLSLVLALPGGSDAGSRPDPEEVSHRLVAAATAASDDQPELARRLATAAYRASPTPEARASVLSILASTNQPVATFSGSDFDVYSVAFSPDGSLLATSGGPGAAHVWDATARGTVDEPLATLTGFTGAVWRVEYSPDGALLATAGGDGAARLWDAGARGTVTRSLAAFTGHDVNSAVAFSPAGDLLATSSYNGEHMVRLWDTSRRGTVDTPLTTFDGQSDGVYTVAFSPDGTVLASGSGGADPLRLWDASGRGTVSEPLASVTSSANAFYDVAFSPDATLLAVGGAGDQVLLWDATRRDTSQEPLATFVMSVAGTSAVAFDPEDTLLASGGEDGSVRLWDSSGRGTIEAPVSTITVPVGGVASVAFSPDATLLAVGGSGGTLVWDLDVDRLVDKACAEPTGALSADEWTAVLPGLPYDPPCGD